MIPKAAVKEYLARPLESFTWLKELDTDELWDAVDALRPRPRLSDKLSDHQLVCFLLGVAYPAFAFWLDMGAGKTLVTLELLNYWFECGRIRRAVIVVKSDKALLTWEKQIARWGFDLPHVLLEGSSAEKWRGWAELDDGLVIVARPGLRHMLSTKVQAKKKSHLRPDKKLVAKFMKGVGALVLDESTDDAHYTSLNHELACAMRKHVDICYELAGRPFGRDPTLLWAQFYILDHGETLGPTLGLFREAFFTAERNPHGGKFSKDFHFKKKMTTQLHRMIQHRSIAYTAEECGTLPAMVPVVEEVRFPQEAGAYYAKAVQSIIKARGDLREIKNVFLRMRQLSSGFVGFKHDETSERVQVEFDENPKFDRLMELLADMPDDAKAVVFYEFTFSGRKIHGALKADGYKPIWLWSGTKDAKAEQRRFENDPDTRVAVINHRVGAYSMDGLQDVANYLFFYESPVSSIDREQAERRLRRQGQKRTVFQYDVIVKGSADAKILAYHKEGADLVAALLHDPGGVLK